MRCNFLGFFVIVAVFVSASAHAAPVDPSPWPAEVSDFKAPAAGEHPRLLFRRDDLPALREKAKTPEGQAIIKRLRATLNGTDGETMPTIYNGSSRAYEGNKPNSAAEVKKDDAKKDDSKNNDKDAGKSQEMPLGAYSFSHVAGYGLLYQLTGDKKICRVRQAVFRKGDGWRPQS